MALLLTIIFAFLGLNFLVAVLSPGLILCFKKKYALELVHSAKWHIYLSIFVLLVTILKIYGISLTHQSINFIVLVITFFCVLFLIFFSFDLKPKLLGRFVGLISVFDGFIWTIFLMFGQVFEGNSPQTVDIGNSMHCRQSVYGFVTSDSGTEIEVFKRYYFIDKLLVSRSFSDVYPENNIKPDSWNDTLTRCSDAFNRKADY